MLLEGRRAFFARFDGGAASRGATCLSMTWTVEAGSYWRQIGPHVGRREARVRLGGRMGASRRYLDVTLLEE